MTNNPFDKIRQVNRISDLLKERDNLKRELNIALKDNATLKRTNDVLTSHVKALEELIAPAEPETFGV